MKNEKIHFLIYLVSFQNVSQQLEPKNQNGFFLRGGGLTRTRPTYR